MTLDWKKVDETTWREEFKKLKGTLALSDLKLLENGASTMNEAWRLGALHAEYKKLKRKQPPDLPDLQH